VNLGDPQAGSTALLSADHVSSYKKRPAREKEYKGNWSKSSLLLGRQILMLGQVREGSTEKREDKDRTPYGDLHVKKKKGSSPGTQHQDRWDIGMEKKKKSLTHSRNYSITYTAGKAGIKLDGRSCLRKRGSTPHMGGSVKQAGEGPRN